MFRGRRLLIAGKHEKEKVLAPILEKELGVTCFTDSGFDSDVLGTFSGETERTLDPVSNAREKGLRALKFVKGNLVLASEGSFGPHPSVFFIRANEEILVFTDTLNKLEISVREISTETNFGARKVHSEQELMTFAQDALFPSHALILRKAREDKTDIFKGITDFEHLRETFAFLHSKYGSVYVETDMRAMFNPSRMRVIEKAAKKLVKKIQSLCPECARPGFGITHVNQGLPCADCGAETRSTLSYLYECEQCHFSKEEMYPHQKTKEDPMYCDRCNP